MSLDLLSRRRRRRPASSDFRSLPPRYLYLRFLNALHLHLHSRFSNSNGVFNPRILSVLARNTRLDGPSPLLELD